MTSQARVKLQVWLLILVVFVLGGVTGGSLDRLYLQRQGAGEGNSNGPGCRKGQQQMLENMKRDLNLSEDQVSAIRAIFDETRKEFQPKRFSNCPGFKEARAKTNAMIKGVLTPEQQIRFDEITQQRERELESAK
jgi:Spy/CpxP family protein refolding chaperone